MDFFLFVGEIFLVISKNVFFLLSVIFLSNAICCCHSRLHNIANQWTFCFLQISRQHFSLFSFSDCEKIQGQGSNHSKHDE